MRYLALTAAAIASAALLAACSREEPAVDPSPTAAAPDSAPGIDAATGLIMAEDWELVRANCTPCHSSRLVTQQRGTEQQWLTMIRWMQASQNLWQFDPDTEDRIVAYLAENYPPDAARRRAAIPPGLMPPNPYSTTE